MKIQAIRELLITAKKHEYRTQQLTQFLNRKELTIFSSLKITNDEHAVEELILFIEHYIDEVPSLLEAINTAATEANVRHHLTSILEVAEDYLLTPPDILPHQGGLEELMHGAYLAHRLIEEINDHYSIWLGKPLLSLDMTKANLIVHTLIGEPLANTLDKVVHISIARLKYKQVPTFTFDPNLEKYQKKSDSAEWQAGLFTNRVNLHNCYAYSA